MTGTPPRPSGSRQHPEATGSIVQHGEINIANSGYVGGDLIVTVTRPKAFDRPEPAASHYLDKVVRRQIAPKVLHARDSELAELARFCTDDDAGAASYVWWRGPAWSGKSALLSWFALHPPPGVRVVAFFLRAHVPHQRDWVAFADNLLRQLADLLAAPVPGGLTDATREETLLALLDEAAETCRRRGERLVLVLDGLDEDLGGHSVTRLLPAEPPAGMRVIVAGRDHPPLPHGGPEEGHPLGDHAVVRVLAASEHATMVRAHAEAEIARLATGSDLEKLLLGLLTAARGGLSEADLAYLAGCSEFEVETQLRTVTGRTFTVQASRFRPDAGPRAYLLAHRELQAKAEHALRGAPLREARERLNTWSDSFRDRGWPAETPEYLLHGYFDMLCEAADVDRMVACATDPARHYRMLDVTGGDTAALTEITAAQQAILARDDPDLRAMARLAIHSSALTERDKLLPEQLPLVWARLGNPIRAESLARSIIEPGRRGFALSLLARSAAEFGDFDRAEALVNDVTYPEWQAEALTAGVRAAAARGEGARAVTLARRAESVAAALTDPGRQAQELTALALAVAETGDVARAEEIAGAVTDPVRRWEALGVLAETVARAGDVTRAEEIAGTITEPAGRAAASSRIAAVLALSGDLDGVRSVLGAIDETGRRAHALFISATAAAQAGGTETAEAISGLITDPERRSAALIATASSLAARGERARAVELAQRAESVLGAVSDPVRRWRGSCELAAVFARAGEIDRAEAIARSRTDPDGYTSAANQVAQAVAAVDVERAQALADAVENPLGRATALLRVATGVTRSGMHPRAIAVLHRAEAAAAEIPDPGQRAVAMSAIALIAAWNGDFAYSDAAVSGIDDEKQTAQVSARLVLYAAEAGNVDRALSVARSMTMHTRSWTLTDAAQAAAAAGRLDAAEAIARSIADREYLAGRLNSLAESHQVRAMALVADAAARAGARARAAGLARDAEMLAYSSVAPQVRQWALEAVATALAVAGDIDTATALAHRLADPDDRLRVLAIIAEGAARASDADGAEIVAAEVSDPQYQAPALAALGRAAARAGDPARAAALTRCADEIARSIAKPYQRASVLAVMAVRAADDGDNQNARTWAGVADTLAHSLPETPGKAAMLARAATAVASAGDTGRAEAIAAHIDEPYHRAEAQAALVHALAKAGDPDRAEAVADAIARPDFRIRALAAVAKALSEAGDHPSAAKPAERAVAAARAIDETGPREQALAAAVIARARAGEISHAESIARSAVDPASVSRLLTTLAVNAPPLPARRAMAHALALGGAWVRLLPALAEIDPATVRAIADEFVTVLGPADVGRGSR